MHVRLWDFGTLKSHCNFLIFLALWYGNTTVTFTMRTRCSPNCKGIENM